jgi:hypothetical protein
MKPRVSEAARRLWLGRVLGNAGTAAVVGITLSLQRLSSALMDAGLNPAGIPWRTAAICTASLCGWGVIAFIGQRWKRHGEFPPTWAVLAVVGLGWAAILFYHLPA